MPVHPAIIPCLRYKDAPRALTFLMIPSVSNVMLSMPTPMIRRR
jgi:hypothetical protein